MKSPGHKMILASAGSGKTYALTNRFIELLAAGAPPDRIAALTFTRKAAGEFFDEILKKLARASVAPEAAAKIAGEIGAPALKPADFQRMLRTMVEAMPRLTLGTLDGFFARVVRAFPLELGLGGDFEILQDQAARLERRRVVRQMFALAGAPGAAQRDFIEAFKRATFGAEEKRLAPQLDRFLEEHAETFLAARDAGAWGRAERIWPAGCEALALAAGRAEAARELEAALAAEQLTDGQRARWEAFFAGHAGWVPGAPLPDAVDYIVGNALKAWPRVGETMVERKRLALAGAAAAALRATVLGIVGAEFARRLEMTQGLCSVLRGYEAVYDGAVRRLGRLTFADLQRMLLPGADGARPLSREAADSRLFIDWRLDAQIDHWLLDEFQDTSFGQWRVLQNLVDEAVQDPTGSRSFFYVGDVKQAIFAWREGDARLFREIFRHYTGAAPGAIAEGRLTESHRSGPEVIEMVNRVFGDRAALARLFPGPAAAHWSDEWEDHTTAKPELGGYASLRRAPDEAGRFAETLRILREVRPLERGLEVAVLVRTNETGAELADYLRREGGLPAVAESDLHVGRDNPLACALVALLRAAAHPRDTAARALVRLTPLEAILGGRGLASPDALSAGLLRQIHDDGFERTVEDWLRRLEGGLAPDDAFSRLRGRQLAAAARLFDEMGGRDVAEFAAFAERYTVRDADAAGAVRVMTVHKAKGLGFDLAILPDLEGRTLASRRRGLAVQKAPDRSVDWVLNLPARELALSDPVLGAHVAAAEADACYENLCLLYVAMTRAKRAMYLVVQPAEKSASLNFPRLLRETLGESWESGDPRWHEGVRAAAGPASASGGLRPLEAGSAPRRAALRPSGRHAGVFAAPPLFELAPKSGAEFGTAVHAWLARVEWAGDAAAGEAGRAAGEAAAEAAACLAAPELAGVWARPARGEAWRERTFELVLDGAWVTGVFDRVVVERDAEGRAARATVFDFKTDQAEGEAAAAAAAERHAAQLGIYRRAAAALAGLPPEKVGAEIVLTRARRRVAIPR